MQVMTFCTLMVIGKDPSYLAFFLFVEAFILLCMSLTGILYKRYHKVLLNHMCMLLSIGLCMISRLSFPKAVKQYAIMIIAFAIGLIIPYVIKKFNKLADWKYIYAAVGILLLAVVWLWGSLTHGANISFSIQGIKFQPSEFVKILYVFFLAGFLAKDTSFKNVAVTSVLAGIHVIILVLSTDLGSALIFFVCYLFVLYMTTENYYYFGGITLLGAGMSVVAYKIFSHVRVRVLAWLDPWKYIDNQGYQITQSLFAIGSGSYFGLGLTKGNPKAIPYVDADFIFSSICEELGLLVGVCVIMICLCCFITMLKIALQCKESFYRIVAFGIGITYIFQIFLTIGGGIKFIPLTGVTLPFVSYGGSSVMTSMFLFAVVQGVYIRSLEASKKVKLKEQQAVVKKEESYDELYEWLEKQSRKNYR